jgi:hypothetical protein
MFPLLFVAPRGLINYYFLIAPEHNILIVNKSLIIQVIINANRNDARANDNSKAKSNRA